MVWIPYKTPINYVSIEGQRTPGFGYVEKAGIIVQWDKIRGYGWGGAVSRFVGVDLSEFNIRYQIWTDQHWADHYAFLPLVAKPPRGTRPKARDLWHPFLEALDIKSVNVQGVSQPHPIEDGTVYEVVVAVQELGKPRRMFGTVQGSKAKSDDPVDRVIENLTGQVNELANG